MTALPAKAKIALIAGFGDNASMYDGLQGTSLADHFDLLPLDLPGFGTPPPAGKTTLASVADWLGKELHRRGATIIAAHSVASIIACLAAQNPKSKITHILSLEGNLVEEDAYFSGRAAEHPNPKSFLSWFTPRIAKRSEGDPILARYAREVAKADPQALWELGSDAHDFSTKHHPGGMLEALKETRVTYIYASVNCPESSLAWLSSSALPRIELESASHWASVDAPEALAKAIFSALTA